MMAVARIRQEELFAVTAATFSGGVHAAHPHTFPAAANLDKPPVGPSPNEGHEGRKSTRQKKIFYLNILKQIDPK